MKTILHDVQRRFPNKLALSDGDITLTYGQLAACVRRSADRLQASGGTMVIKVACRIKAIVMMLAAIEKDIPFVPLDPDTPQSVCDPLYRQFGAIQIITDVDLASGKSEISTRWHEVPEDGYGERDFPRILSVMFTSGTTGKPKGVLVPSDAVLNLLWQPGFIPLQENDIFATYSPLSFDASTFEIFTPLLNGNTLIILDKMDIIDARVLANKIKRFGITCMWVTAGLFNQQINASNYPGLAALRLLVIGGDKVDFGAALKYLATPHAGLLFNGYGPTENTIFATVAPLKTEALMLKKAVPIGSLVRGVEYLILEPNTKQMTKLGSGNLLLSGKGLALGYLHDETSTRNAFLEVKGESSAYYNTGDNVRVDDDGTFYFIGRHDRQIKLNGHRVELDDIAVRLEQSTVFKRAMCFFIDFKLVAVVETADPFMSDQGIRNVMEEILHDYERPKLIIKNTHWPLTGNSKLDVKKIRDKITAERRTTPINNNEQGYDIIILVKQILGIAVSNKSLGLFDIGFDSINITRFQAAIQEKYQIAISILDIYSAGNLMGIEDLIKRQTARDGIESNDKEAYRALTFQSGT